MQNRVAAMRGSGTVDAAPRRLSTKQLTPSTTKADFGGLAVPFGTVPTSHRRMLARHDRECTTLFETEPKSELAMQNINA